MKKFLISVTVLIIALSAFGCGGVNDMGKLSKSNTLKIWTTGSPLHHAYGSMGEDDPDSITTRMIIDTFKEKFPDAKIVLESQGWGTDLNNALRSAQISNKMPDIVVGELFIKSQIKKKYFTELVVPRQTKDAIDDVYWSQVTGEDGKIYGYPFITGCFALVYNEQMFKEAGVVDGNGQPVVPETVEQMRNTAAKIKTYYKNKGQDNKGGIMVNAVPGVASAYRNTLMMQLFGGGFYDDNGNLIIDSAESAAAMEYVKSLVEYTPSGNISLNEEAQINKLFLNNNCAMAIEIPTLMYTDTGISTDNYKVAPLPTVGANRSTNLLVGSLSYMVTRSCSNKELAQAFLEHLVSKQVQEQVYMCSSYRLPVRNEVIMDMLVSEDEKVLARNEKLQPYIDSLFSADRLVAGLPSFDESYSTIWQSWTTAVQGIVTGKTEPQKALKTFADVVRTKT